MKQLILNPVENLPHLFNENRFSETHGFYISDKNRTDSQIKEGRIGFSGRNELNQKVLDIYSKWAKTLEVEELSMRLLSGLHAHIVLFMGLGKIGDKVLLLPEIAGGHFATHAILKRLGYDVFEMIPDCENFCVNQKKTKEFITEIEPDFIFVDRSEGIFYEDFSYLLENIPEKCCALFDASQYLTNILMKDYTSPFEMGFHIMLSTLHKNFPGPQKALVCSKKNDDFWTKILDSMVRYVSNLHAYSIFIAGDILNHTKLLTIYSRRMLENSILLTSFLDSYGLPVVKNSSMHPETHHIWLNLNDEEKAYSFYKKMEQCNLLVNYRKLPYKLGYGIRMGTSAATLQGINPKNMKDLAIFIHKIYTLNEIPDRIIYEIQEFISSLQPLTSERSFIVK